MEFQERNNVQIAMFSTGATAEQVTPYYGMQGYRRADFYVSGLVQLPASGALGATDFQMFTCRVIQASNSTGGGATGISSATAVVGKNSATGVGTAVKMREGRINWSTMTSAAPLDLVINGYTYTCATATAAGNQYTCASGAAATVAMEAFVTMFNGTNNTSTAITANWQAATMAGAWARIIPKDPDGTHLLAIGTTGSSRIGVGGVFIAHIGVEQQFMADGKTHLAVGVYSTEHANPYTVHVVRQKEIGPVVPVTYSKSINQSTSK
jgi:hypothetical protein